MDDEAVYGPHAHRLSFAAAAQKDIICRYKVIVSLIDKEMVDDFTRKHGITIVENDEIGARWVANLIAIQRAVETVGASKIISFHSRVALAQEFAATSTRGLPFYLPGYDVRHVNGAQSSADRSAIIRAFRSSPKAVLTNARCLTEGVDIPAVDMVAFIDPRQSRIDIAQAVGRAMRKPRGATTKTVGYVVVPLFAGMGADDDLDTAIKSEKFAAVADVLNALQEHDEELVDIIREIRERKGQGQPFNPKRLVEKVQVLGPRVELDRLTQSIDIEIADRLGSNWDEMFGLLRKFNAREGNCLVPQVYSEDGANLGTWTAAQRRARNRLLPERKRRLDELGFVWDAVAALWEAGFAALAQFKEREGNCLVPQQHLEDGLKLGTWVGAQRMARDQMLPERKRRLDGLGFVWDVDAAVWEAGFAALAQYKEREGNCRVPWRHNENGVKLSVWVATQRDKQNAADRKKRLDDIGFVWDPLTAAWNEGYAALLKFKAREGNCYVGRGHMEDGYSLGNWAGVQRLARDSMIPSRKAKLDAVGFLWHLRDAKWEDGFSALSKYKSREGDCLVPGQHEERGFKLGVWVDTQRQQRDQLPVDRKNRLDALGFVWKVLDADWEKGFAALLEFKAREDHCRVPQGYVEGGFKLATWVYNQRNGRLSPERKTRLTEMGFSWSPRDADWEDGFAALLKYKAEKGDCRVPQGYNEDGYRLGAWVSRQRHSAEKMPGARKQRLDEAGFVWDTKGAHDAKWEDGFSALSKYKSREGDCLVPHQYEEGGFKLGVWVAAQRQQREQLLVDRKSRLDDIGFVWNVLDADWEKGFMALVEFKAREGHCRVPHGYVEGDFKFGKWVSVQRLRPLSSERKARLTEIGFSWSPHGADWEDGFAALQKYKAEKGHCRVPQDYNENGHRLGAWVSRQRQSAEKMKTERKQRLDEIGFVWDTKAAGG